jgi:Holliday junction resolvasome RuvABC endonuclease subunit
VKVLCVDPGPTSSGWASLDVDSWEVLDSGTADWDELITKVRSGEFGGVAVEQAIMYTLGGKSAPNNKTVVEIVFHVGRIYQVAKDCEVEFRQKIRSDIIRDLTGKKPSGKGNRVSKTDMQNAVQSILNLTTPIRPQHANDAVCAGLALWGHPHCTEVGLEAKAARNNDAGKAPRRRARAAKQLALCVEQRQR